MSEVPPLPDLWSFMRSYDPDFDGTSFSITLPNGKLETFYLSRFNYELWDKIKEEYRKAVLIDSTIHLDIPFCIAYQEKYIPPTEYKQSIIFGWKISVWFPVPQNVQNFFKFCTALDLDQKVNSLSSNLQRSASEITDLEALIDRSKEYLKELVAEVDQHRSDLAELKSNFQEADQWVKALTNLLDASRKVTSLLERDLVVLRPDFFSVAEDCERRSRIYSDQIRALQALISQKDRMVFDQSQAIAQIEANLRALYLKQRETESAIRQTRKEIFQELSKFGDDVLPHQLCKYVEESRLHLNKQKAALILASYLRKVSDRNFVGSRIESAPTMCSICCTSQPNYFMLGCGHGAYCVECIKKFANRCPSCKSSITFVKPLDLFAKKLFMQ